MSLWERIIINLIFLIMASVATSHMFKVLFPQVSHQMYSTEHLGNQYEGQYTDNACIQSNVYWHDVHILLFIYFKLNFIMMLDCQFDVRVKLLKIYAVFMSIWKSKVIILLLNIVFIILWTLTQQDLHRHFSLSVLLTFSILILCY